MEKKKTEYQKFFKLEKFTSYIGAVYILHKNSEMEYMHLKQELTAQFFLQRRESAVSTTAGNEFSP